MPSVNPALCGSIVLTSNLVVIDFLSREDGKLKFDDCLSLLDDYLWLLIDFPLLELMSDCLLFAMAGKLDTMDKSSPQSRSGLPLAMIGVLDLLYNYSL